MSVALATEWTVQRTLDELPDQTLGQLKMRDPKIFPLPESTTERYDQMIPDEVKDLYHQLRQQRQQRTECSQVAEAFRLLNLARLKEEEQYMNDDERRKQKRLDRMREKLKRKNNLPQ